MIRALLFVALVAMLLAAAACTDCDCQAAPDSTAGLTTEPTAVTAAEPMLDTGGLALPDVDALVIPLLSESDLEASLLNFPGVAPSVMVEGSSIIYSGDMHPEGYEILVRLAQQDEVTELVISSLGGEVYWGMKIGEVVHEKGWNVRVRGLCFSSCANYIFPAGGVKVIEDGGIVGWHGSARQSHFFAEQQGTSSRQQIAESLALALQEGGGTLTQEEFDGAIMHNIALSETRIELERAYYERIGVDADISVYAFFPQHFATAAGAGGWTYTLGDMEKFGLDGIIYEGSEAYPSDGARALLSLVLIEVDKR